MNASLFNNENGFSRVSWSAVVAGVAAALSAEVILNFLGIGLGLTSLDLSANTLFKAGVESIIWLVLSGIITMGLGGVVAGVISNSSSVKNRMLHGLLVWSFATLITVATITTTAGMMVGGASNIFRNSINVSELNNLNHVSSYSTQSSNSTSEQSGHVLDDKNIKEVANNLGSVSIIIFIAFLISALSGVASACWGGGSRKQSFNK